MKYIVILGDGMSDEPVESLAKQTPLAYAKTPALDSLAPLSEIGLAATIPQGMSPGSDTANLSVLGYDPRQYYTGRSPLEALSIGVEMKPTDIAIRCNLVTLSEQPECYREKTIIDHSAGEISTEDAHILLEAVKEQLQTAAYQFYTGTSYRHLVIWDRGQVVELIPPHDILGKAIGAYLPVDPVLAEMMEKSYEILNHHPLNLQRAREGKNKANSLWFWGAGTRPSLSSFEEKTGKKGAMISAVDLLKGIAIGAQMEVIQVPGADGSLHTNYEGKAMAAVETLIKGGNDFVYIHVEAPDEMGHQGNVENKVTAIEYLDQRVIKIVVEQLTKAGEDFRLLVMPDHPTPLRLRTHVADPVPYLLYDSTKHVKGEPRYTEAYASKTGLLETHGHHMIDRLLERESYKA